MKKYKSVIEGIKNEGINYLQQIDNRIILGSNEIIGKINAVSDDVKIVKVVDNIKDPTSSVSRVCQCKGCNKRIRIEYITKDRNNKQAVYGAECLSTVMNLNAGKTSLIKKLPDVIEKENRLDSWLDEKRKYKEYTVSNRRVIDKLRELSKSGLMLFVSLYDLSKTEKLSDEDLDYIWYCSKDKANERAEMAKVLELMMNKAKNSTELEYLQEIYERLQLNQNIREKQKDMILEFKNEEENDMKCPYCGGKLVEKESEYGKFYGCSNFIKGCRYKKPIRD